MVARVAPRRGPHPIAQVGERIVGLGDDVGRTGPEGAGHRIEAAPGRHHDDRRQRRVLLGETQQIEATQRPRGVQIDEHDREEAVTS